MATETALITKGRALLLALSIGLTACTGVITLSEEEPYSKMIGQCYEVQQPMYIRENICWELGGLILTPGSSKDCFKATVYEVEMKSRLVIVDVRRKGWGSAGFCPQAVVSLEGVDIPSREIFIPLCLSAVQISWLEDPLWQRGDEIRLKKEYVLPCEFSD
ncbi:hypothetical protein CWE08_12095 [Aliidiomarina iranensis]|uniref:Uncharacterized protein n=1 Tax=Aliidiomarina iranensis TaxID=1434071 RepID=A0A432VPC7_9GAMM|nr:hypothetical protein [Aliidiomarina iranensis]RUO18002.1 hypothetical protein CWE08_12095 [Aliidiomarina iranensis]